MWPGTGHEVLVRVRMGRLGVAYGKLDAKTAPVEDFFRRDGKGYAVVTRWN